TTVIRVIHNILRSSQKDQLSTYQTSYANFSSQESAFLPFTWAHPVIPGRTSWRRAGSGVYNGKYSISNGRGPTRLMSPLSTLNSSGSSSKLVLRKKRPNLVSRCSSGKRRPFSSRASVIVRNLYIVNGRPCNPGRTCLKITGLPAFAQTKAAITSISGDKTMRSTAEAVTSKSRFPTRLTMGNTTPLRTRPRFSSNQGLAAPRLLSLSAADVVLAYPPLESTWC